MLAALTDSSCKWDFKTWPKIAKKHGLVLTGWGPHMCSNPTSQWVDKRTGGLTRDNWKHLVWRIPRSWRNNPHHDVPAGELPLQLVTLEEFLGDSEHGQFLLTSLHSPPYLSPHPEFEGRHPCVVNHTGHVLHFAGEDKEELADTAPPKKRATKTRVRSKPQPKKGGTDYDSEASIAAKLSPRRRQAKRRSPTPSDPSSDDNAQSDRVQFPSPRFLPAGLPSPSGNHRKRSRVQTATPRSFSGESGELPRALKPKPAPEGFEVRKRKRSETEPAPGVDQFLPPSHPPWQPASDVPFFPPRAESVVPQHHAGRGVTPMYTQPFNSQPPFGPYAGRNAFPAQAYQQPYYQPPYGQPPWNAPATTTTHPWPAGAPMGIGGYSAEDVAAFMESRMAQGNSRQPQR